MYRALLALVLALAASTVLAEKPVATSYQQLHDEWKTEKQALASEFADPSPEKLAELKRRSLDLQRRYTTKFLELAKKDLADSDTWQACLLWVTVEGAPGDDFDAMVDLMKEQAKELREPLNLQLMLSNFIELSSHSINPALRELAENHPARSVRGAALFVLGARLKSKAEEAGSRELCAEAETVLKQVVDEFPDVRTYRGENRKNAERLLDELRGPLAIGQIALEIRGHDLQGRDFSLRELRGKVVVVSFSGHWCVPCRAMHPIEKQLIRNQSPKDVELVEINSDKDPDAVATKMLQDELTWLCIVEGSTNGPIAQAWQIRSWPTFYVLDREQIIRHKASGNIGEKLIDWVNELKSEQR